MRVESYAFMTKQCLADLLPFITAIVNAFLLTGIVPISSSIRRSIYRSGLDTNTVERAGKLSFLRITLYLTYQSTTLKVLRLRRVFCFSSNFALESDES